MFKLSTQQDGQLPKFDAALSHRQKAIVEWCNNSDAKPHDLLTLIQTDSLPVSTGRQTLFGMRNRQYDWETGFLTECRAIVVNQEAIFKTVGSRLGELFECLAEDSDLRASLTDCNWGSLVNFAHLVLLSGTRDSYFNLQNAYCGISQGVCRLQETFDREESLPRELSSNWSVCMEFSRLLGLYQIDLRYKDRWRDLILQSGDSASKDKTLIANYRGAWQAYCLMPELIPYEEFLVVARSICQREAHEFKCADIRARIRDELFATPSVCMHDLIQKALLELTQEFGWLSGNVTVL